MSGTSRRLPNDKVQAILNVPKPKTKKGMRCLLGMAGYCRQWVPDYAALVGPLLDMMLDKALEPVAWTKQAEENLGKVKTAVNNTSLGFA